MPTKKPNKAKEIIGKIFKDTDLIYGLKEFEDIKIEEVLEITEDESHRFYLADIKTGQKRFVYDEKKGNGKPEEIVRQLWLHKLNQHYGYPLDRIETEKHIHFGKEIHAKAAAVVVSKKDKITPYILLEVKSPTERKDIIESMEELVLANAGVDVFTEVFKLIYAKLYDEQEAKVNRKDNEVFFRKYRDPSKTYSVINDLFKKAIKRWPGTFFEQENINLSQEHLSIVVGELERTRLFGSDLSIVDEAFEYLIPEVAKGKKGQY